MDLEELRAFLAVADSGSFLTAAKTLRLSRATLRRRIDQLGGWCETQLCERGEYGLEEGGDAWKSLGWCWTFRNAECRRILRGFWGLLGAASG